MIERSLAMKKILVVDDSEAARNSLGFSLQMNKYEVIKTGSGEEAIEAMKRVDNISLLITDMNMPGMGGIGLVKTVRADTKYKFIPILVLSTDEEKGKEAMKSGASAFVLKSSRASDDVKNIVTRLLGG
jgi:two-component system, chemotaxis family, chemotaxis protein CheY